MQTLLAEMLIRSDPLIKNPFPSLQVAWMWRSVNSHSVINHRLTWRCYKNVSIERSFCDVLIALCVIECGKDFFDWNGRNLGG